MNWATVVQLIITYGIDQAYKIWQIAKSGEPDEAAWEQLRQLSLKSYDEYIEDARRRAAHEITLIETPNLPPIPPPTVP